MLSTNSQGLQKLGSRSILGSLVLFGAISSISIFAGLVATTASPILIGVFVGVVLGLGLLARMDFALWLVVVGTLLVGGLILQFFPQLSKAAWLFSMIGFLLFAGALLHWISKPVSARNLPWFTWLALAFPLYAVLVSLVNLPTIWELLAGFKRYFQFWGVFAALALIPFNNDFLRKLLRFVFILGLIQVAFATYQLLIVVPTRVGMGGGVVAIDAVSGTFESTSTGGGSSSILAMFVLLLFAYVLSAWRGKILNSRRAILASLALLAPLFMGETKIVIILLPLVVIVVMQRELRRNPFAGLLIMLFTAGLTVALAYLYLSMSATGHDSAERTLERVIAYNFGSVGYHELAGLNRTTVLTFWWGKQSWAEPTAFLFGHGIGASYAGEGTLVPGHLTMKYHGLAIAFTGLSVLLWDTGVLGVTWFLLMMFGAILHCHRLAKKLPTGELRSIAIATEAGLLMTLVLFPYSNSMFSLPSHEVILMLLLASATLLVKQASK